MFMYIFSHYHHFLDYQQEDNIFAVMGQFLDYLASVFTNRTDPAVANSKDKQSTDNHVGHGESSFTYAFKSNENKASKLASLCHSNKKTIYIYQAVAVLSFLIHLSLVTVPKIKLDTFDILQPENWQLVTLNLVPLVVYFASIGAMNEINRPLLDGAKLSTKTSGLDLNQNDFIHSLKIVIILMAMCQVSSVFSDHFLWSAVLIVQVWCYQLTSKLAQNEYQRYAPSPKKQWVKLNLPKSPKLKSSAKQAIAPPKKDIDAQVKATPRTRTRRAVKTMIDGVSDKYHAFEQNVAHQLTTKILNPLSPKLKMLENQNAGKSG